MDEMAGKPITSRVLKIGDLEKLSGMPRTTIYFYTRQGLVPSPQKIGRSRALYGDQHARALAEIRRLKDRGLSLEEITAAVRGTSDSVSPPAVDLVAQMEADTRTRILETATRHFANRGYAGTKIADIVHDLGMAPAIFYRYFPNKRKLFLDTVEAFSDGWFQKNEAAIRLEPDPIRRQMLRAAAFLGLLQLSPDLLTFIRAEAMTHGGESHEALRRTYARMIQPLVADFAEARKAAGRLSGHDDELLAIAWVGVLENTAMRVAWDKKYSEADFYWVTLQMIVPILESRAGECDLRQEPRYVAMVESLVERRAQDISTAIGERSS